MTDPDAMFFRRPKPHPPFFYPDGEPLLEGDALLWGPGGFYGGRVAGFLMEATTGGPVARYARIDEGGPVEKLLDRTTYQPDDARLVERNSRDFRGACVRWLATRVGEGNAHSMFVLGSWLRDGHLVPQDLQRASTLLEESVSRGHPAAMVELALMLEAGGPAQAVRVHALMQRAAERGMPEARRWLAGRSGATGTAPEALKTLRANLLAAEAGDVMSMCLVAEAFDLGRGIAADPEKAVHWYRRAVERGHPAAMCNLADKYEHGRGVAQDLAEAVRLYRAAADRNVLAAQFSLGEMYRDGRGVPRDPGLARTWLERAAQQGFGPAREALARLPA